MKTPRLLFWVITLSLVSLLTIANVSAQNLERYLIADIVDLVRPAIVSIWSILPGGQANGGTGFIYNSDGLILTNDHVVKGASKVIITFSDGVMVEDVAMIGSDEATDIAVLKINDQPYVEGLPFLRIGDSQNIRVGEWVIAVGSPFATLLGIEPSVTLGIVSAKNRNLEVRENAYYNWIQTDVALNLGNSGGPLINLDGEVIGINTASFRFAQGIGFALPIETALRIANEILVYGKAIRPWFGVRLKDSLAPDGLNVIVEAVEKNSPAAKAGIIKGDVLIQIDRIPITNKAQAYKIYNDCEIGQTVLISIRRDGFRHDLIIEVTSE